VRIKLERVHFMPKVLEPGVLYFAEEYGAAAHLCACGCGTKIRTPIGPTEWSVDEGSQGVSLHPSIGNWQLPCRSHYLITRGEVIWSGRWTEDQIQMGREREVSRRSDYYAIRQPGQRKPGILLRLWRKFSR